MGYYPTDEPVIEAIQTLIAPAETKARLLDPCAGEGRAASLLGQGAQLRNLGCGAFAGTGGKG